MNLTIDANEFEGVIQRAVDATIRRLEAEHRRDNEGQILLDKKRAAERLGVSTKTLDRLRRKGLACVRLDGRVMFRPETLEQWAEDSEASGG